MVPKTDVAPAFKVKEVVVIVKGSIVTSKVAPITLFSGTSIALFNGSVEITAGIVLAVVVKVHTLLAASGAPFRLIAPVVIVAVYTRPGKRSTVGLNDAVVPVYVTAPATEVAPCFKVNVVPVRVKGSIATLKLAVTVLVALTPIALLIGSVKVTVGAMSDVNDHT